MAAFIATFEFCVFIMNDFVITLLHNANSLIFACKTIAYILKMTDCTKEMGKIFS